MSRRRRAGRPGAGPTELTADAVRRLRMGAQGLGADRASQATDAVRHVLALPAQDTRAARLAVRARTVGLDAHAVVRACGPDRSLVRTWLMRGTLHAVAAEDVRWLLALLGPRFVAADARRRRELGLDDDTCRRGMAAIEAVLDGEPPLTRDDLVERLAARRLRLDPASQAPAHLLAYASLHGLVCRGPDGPRDEATYVLLEDWVPTGRPGPRGEEALAALARRYLRGHAPATADDLRAWSGLPARDARHAITLVADELTEVATQDGVAWTPRDTAVAPARPVVRMLGGFDPYLLGYRDRALAVPPGLARRVRAGGMIAPTVVVGGWVVATWRPRRTSAGLMVAVQPLEKLRNPVRAAIEAEAEDVGRFLGLPATVAVEEPLPEPCITAL